MILDNQHLHTAYFTKLSTNLDIYFHARPTQFFYGGQYPKRKIYTFRDTVPVSKICIQVSNIAYTRTQIKEKGNEFKPS